MALKNNLEQDDDNADELGESGGMRGRLQPRKPSTQEVEAHMIDHYPFRSWCRYLCDGSVKKWPPQKTNRGLPLSASNLV